MKRRRQRQRQRQRQHNIADEINLHASSSQSSLIIQPSMSSIRRINSLWFLLLLVFVVLWSLFESWSSLRPFSSSVSSLYEYATVTEAAATTTTNATATKSGKMFHDATRDRSSNRDEDTSHPTVSNYNDDGVWNHTFSNASVKNLTEDGTNYMLRTNQYPLQTKRNNDTLTNHSDDIMMKHTTTPPATKKKSVIPLTPAQQCRLDLVEQYLNPMIDTFISMGQSNPPIIDWMWDMGHPNPFIVNIKFDSIQYWKNQVLYGATWYWKDQFNQTFVAKRIMEGSRQLIHLAVPTNTTTTTTTTNTTEQQQLQRSIPQFLWFSNYTLPINRTIVPWIYDLRPFVKCDHLDQQEDQQTMTSSTTIAMCTKFAGNHAELLPFIAYHRMIGVPHFWIYLNEAEFDITDLPQLPYITYVPYSIIMIGKPKIRGIKQYVRPPAHFFQHEVQQQCLYRAKKVQLDWIMTNDVDEYLWLNAIETQHNENDNDSDNAENNNNDNTIINNGTKLSSSTNASLLSQFLQPYENDPNLGSLLVRGWAFGSNKNQSNEDVVLHKINWTLRAASPCGGKDKHIYRVPIARDVGVHWLFDGGNVQRLPIQTVRWNHYRRTIHSNRVVFEWNRAKNKTLVQDTRLRDKYGNRIDQWIQRHATSQRENGTMST